MTYARDREKRMSATLPPQERPRTTAQLIAGHLALSPLNSVSLRDQAYTLLKEAIAGTDIYSQRQRLRLDERELMQALGVSRSASSVSRCSRASMIFRCSTIERAARLSCEMVALRMART